MKNYKESYFIINHMAPHSQYAPLETVYLNCFKQSSPVIRYTKPFSYANPSIAAIVLPKSADVRYWTANGTFMNIRLCLQTPFEGNCLYLAQKPPVGQGLLIQKVSRSHNDAPELVGLLWNSDQLVAEISTWQQKLFFFWHNSSPVGQGLLIHEVSRSHTTTHQNW